MHLFLVRHGQFVGNITTEDTPDGPLTTLGRDEAALAGAVLACERLTHILASPLMRGLETASIIAAQCGMRFAVWKETYEYRSKGRYIGPSLAMLQTLYPLADFADDMEPDGWVCGGVETPADVVERAKTIAHRLRTEFGPEDRVAMVSHAGFNGVLLGVLLGVQNPHSVRFRQSNCCINQLRITDETILVEALNKTDHIAATAALAAQQLAPPLDKPAS